MLAGLALLPSLVVLVAVLGLKSSGLTAAGAATVTAALLWLSGAFGTVEPAALSRALGDAGVLTVLVAAMVVPGILFVEATRGRKSPEAVGALVAAIGARGPRGAILIATGIGVATESLTGMGVSLLITMPLLLRSFEARAAIAIGLIGMSLMPWGALAISAHVGAKLAGVPVETLALWIAAVSGPVAFLLPLLILRFAGARSASDWAAALAAGAVLAGSIALASRLVGVEVAGVAGGIAVIGLMVAMARGGTGLGEALASRGLVPYYVLLAAVVAQKIAVAPLAALGIAPALDTGRVQFAALTSPGVALLAATLLTAARQLGPALIADVVVRAWRPIASIALFMLTARLLVECGAIRALAQSLGGLGRDGALVAVGLLGAVGGFVTGSGVTGNALFMPSAAAAGAAFAPGGADPRVSVPALVFAALQNGASGHVGMASLPVAAIMLATLPRRAPEDEALVMRLGLALAAWHLAVATVAALLVYRVAS